MFLRIDQNTLKFKSVLVKFDQIHMVIETIVFVFAT